ncbi:MAG: ribonuclease P protein component [Rhodocyclaceae bacterium]|nr:ribonuclease P protein component [Rhodocyclaceae bacterium]
MAGDASFRPEHRLRRAEEYTAVFSARQVVRRGAFDLHFTGCGGVSARLGLVIPKKIARHAVLRNSIKRIAREIFRRRRVELPALDLVLRLARKPEGGVFDKVVVHRDLEALIQRIAGQSS